MKRIVFLRRLSLGAACAVLTGILYLAVILYAVAIPAGQRFETGNFFEHYGNSPVLMNFLWTVMAAVFLLSLVVIPAVGSRLGEEHKEWTGAAYHFGIAGSIVSAASFLTMLGSAPGLAQAYREGDAAGRAAINAVGLPQLDPLHRLAVGGMGTWFLIINVIALRGRIFLDFTQDLGFFRAPFCGLPCWPPSSSAMLSIRPHRPSAAFAHPCGIS